MKQNKQKTTIVKQPKKMKHSCYWGSVLWLLGIVGRNLIHRQQTKQLVINDVFTVSKKIQISRNRALEPGVNYFVCDVDRMTYTLMMLDRADYSPFQVTKKAVKKALIRKDL